MSRKFLFDSQDLKNPMIMQEYFMRKALLLAQKGFGKTSPNPLVGAVVVKNNKIIGEGFHRKAGTAHAEVLALQNLNKDTLYSSTLYVTLEPCCHVNKRTSPCTDFIIQSGIRSVVVAVKDPNPHVNGKGIQKLRKAGLDVKVGVLKKKSEKMNEVFFKTMQTAFPFVVVKTAMSLDGKIATAIGDSRWISNTYSRRYVHQLRSCYDAVLTTSATVLNDNPHLGVRFSKGRDPLRIIIDRHLQTSVEAQVYRNHHVLVVTSLSASQKKKSLFVKKNIQLLEFKDNFELSHLFELLKAHGIMSVLIETGGTFLASLIKEKLIDKYLFFVAPILIGEEGKNVVGKLSFKKLSESFLLQFSSVQYFGNDILIEAYPKL